jgi:hypothetical protein
MAQFELPLRADLPRVDFVLSLDGVAYKFLFAWSTRESGWYMSLFLEDDTPIWLGVRVVVNWPLQLRSRSKLRPPGIFTAFDSAEEATDPGLNDLGVRVRILYFDAASVAALRTTLEA